MEWYDKTGYLDFPFQVERPDDMSEGQVDDYLYDYYQVQHWKIIEATENLTRHQNRLDEIQSDCLDAFMDEECDGVCSQCKLRIYQMRVSTQVFIDKEKLEIATIWYDIANRALDLSIERDLSEEDEDEEEDYEDDEECPLN